MQAIPYGALALATLLYLLIDIFPQVKSFRGIFACGSFWLLWFVFVILNLIAWGALEVALAVKAVAFVGRPELAALLLVVLATLGTVTILQSFTVKAAEVKLVDIGPLVEKYRLAVLAAVADKVRDLRRIEEQKIALKLTAKFTGNVAVLRNHYHTAFAFGGITIAEITTQMTILQNQATASGLPFEQLLAVDIVKADVTFARTLL
jgi:hypothetical protein